MHTFGLFMTYNRTQAWHKSFIAEYVFFISSLNNVNTHELQTCTILYPQQAILFLYLGLINYWFLYKVMLL